MTTLLNYLSGKSSYLVALAILALLGLQWKGIISIPPATYVLLMAVETAFLRAQITSLQASGPNTPQNVPIQNGPKGNGLAPGLSLFLIAGCALFLTGCTTITKHGYIFAETTRTLGARVVSTSTTTGTPEVDFGWVSQTLYFLPTATNATFAVPNVAANFGVNNSGSATGLATDITESFASGNYGIGATSNNWSSVPANLK